VAAAAVAERQSLDPRGEEKQKEGSGGLRKKKKEAEQLQGGRRPQGQLLFPFRPFVALRGESGKEWEGSAGPARKRLPASGLALISCLRIMRQTTLGVVARNHLIL
jgi:hypothetical protein